MAKSMHVRQSYSKPKVGCFFETQCRSETCCTRLPGNAGRKKDAKSRHLGTIAQLCRAISSQLRHVSTIGKNLVSGWDRSGSLGHPRHFQRLSLLGSVTARQSSSERQPNFAALNRGHHLCSTGRPSRWALAHILVLYIFYIYSWALSLLLNKWTKNRKSHKRQY